jgi:replicative DNA helicase
MYLDPRPSGGAWPNNEPPPTAIQSEMLLLSALIRHGSAARALLPRIAAQQFADPLHGRIFEALTMDRPVDQIADLATLTAEFGSSGVLNDIGGAAYLVQLDGLGGPFDVVPDRAGAITDSWLRRQLLDLGEAVAGLAANQPGILNGAETLDLAEKRIADLRAAVGAPP